MPYTYSFNIHLTASSVSLSFSYDGRWKQKLQTYVDFPLENLDLTQYVIGPKQGLKKYNLYGMSVSMRAFGSTFRSVLAPYAVEFDGKFSHETEPLWGPGWWPLHGLLQEHGQAALVQV